MSNEDMISNHWWRRIPTITAAVAAGILLVGYMSSFTSRGQCESMTAERLARELGTGDVFVLTLEELSSPMGYPGSEAILRKSGFSVTQCDSSRAQMVCLPWAGVARGEVIYPFVVDVRWGFVAAPTSGAGTRSRYMTFFGAAFLLMDTWDWPFVL